MKFNKDGYIRPLHAIFILYDANSRSRYFIYEEDIYGVAMEWGTYICLPEFHYEH